jgi:hypothetical protein
MVKYAAAGLNLKVERNLIISERHKTAKQKVQSLHVAKIGAYLPVDGRQAGRHTQVEQNHQQTSDKKDKNNEV